MRPRAKAAIWRTSASGSFMSSTRVGHEAPVGRAAPRRGRRDGARCGRDRAGSARARPPPRSRVSSSTDPRQLLHAARRRGRGRLREKQGQDEQGEHHGRAIIAVAPEAPRDRGSGHRDELVVVEAVARATARIRSAPRAGPPRRDGGLLEAPPRPPRPPRGPHGCAGRACADPPPRKPGRRPRAPGGPSPRPCRSAPLPTPRCRGPEGALEQGLHLALAKPVGSVARVAAGEARGPSRQSSKGSSSFAKRKPRAAARSHRS